MHGPEAGGRVDGLLAELWQAGGTDLLLTAGMPPQLRVHGQLTAVPGWPPLSRTTRSAGPCAGSPQRASTTADVNPTGKGNAP